MPDLRRQVLESGKTVSRKARSRVSSAPSSNKSSPANSRAASRSRANSDDEADSVASLESNDEIYLGDGAAEDHDLVPEAWAEELQTRMEHLIDRKRTSTEGREESLNVIISILKIHYANRELDRKLSEFVPALLRSIGDEENEKEALAALKALELVIITAASESVYEDVGERLKAVVMDSASEGLKVAAIHTLSTAASYGGASDWEIEKVMDIYLEIVESDGHSIAAGDDGTTVTAALEEWIFLSTQLDDLEDQTSTALDAFVDQLDSSDLSVQVAAAENIAFLYEWNNAGLHDSDDSDEDLDDSEEEGSNGHGTLYRNEAQLKHTLKALSSVSAKKIGKKNKKNLSHTFTDVIQAIERPHLGPRYSTAVNWETGRQFGSRMKIRFSGMQGDGAVIDSWWKFLRLKALQRILGSGLGVHYNMNEAVRESLPLKRNKKTENGDGA